MPKKTVATKKFQYKTPALILTAALFAIAGVILLNKSSAAPVAAPAQVGFLNNASVANNDGVTVFTSQDVVAGLGTQYVSDITPGKQLTYVMGGKLASTNTCYYIRVYNSPKAATQVTTGDVTVVGTNSSRTVTLPADDNYREVCVPAGKQAQLPYNVANLSPSAYVLVYQAVLHY